MSRMARSFYLVLLCIGCWRSFVIAAKPCIPEVRGEPFVQYAESKNCEVDEKLLKLFNPVSFNESVVNRLTANFMCTGFIDALNVTRDSTLENLCVFRLLSDIRDTNFCSDSKMMTVLEEVVDSSVFDKISITVANFTRQHCHPICDSSNELCWAFGITAKLVLKQSVTSAISPTTVTEPTTKSTAAATTDLPLPHLFDVKTQTSDSHNNDDDTSEPVDDTSKPVDDTSEPVDDGYWYQDVDHTINTDNGYYGMPDDTSNYHGAQPTIGPITTPTPYFYRSNQEYPSASSINFVDGRHRSCWPIVALLFIFIGVAGYFAMYRRSKISESVPVVKVIEAGLS